MCDFKTVTGDDSPLDPGKRVRYVEGMVLGTDEFRQDQTFHLEARRLHQRALHGYGPVCGLHVRLRGEDADPEVVVEPGLALSPRGETIRVDTAQCAKLNDWLERNSEEVAPPPASPPEELELFVVLCYHECTTDPVPIPSGPCRTVEDGGTDSRIASHFELFLATTPPAQPEEDAARLFADLLGRIEITEDPGTLSPQDIEDAVRSLVTASPPPASPPETLPVHPDAAADVLRAAFRVWSREVRPQLLDDSCVTTPEEHCVLLARLSFPVTTASALAVDGPVSVDEDVAPLLLSSHLVQAVLGYLGGPATTPPPTPSGAPAVIGLGEEGLTRIVGLSWTHGGSFKNVQALRGNLARVLDLGSRPWAFVVAFGKQDGSEGGIQTSALAPFALEVDLDVPDESRPIRRLLRLEPREIRGVRVARSTRDGRISQVRMTTEAVAPALAFVLGASHQDEIMATLGTVVRIVIRGDLLVDENGERAVDAYFRHAALPAGGGAPVLGLQGGTFESWISRATTR